MLENEIKTRLAEYQDPYLKKDLMAAKALKRLHIDKDRIVLDIILGYPIEGMKHEVESILKNLLNPLMEGRTLQINLSSQIDTHTGAQGLPALANVKNIIAVASGKGGVGKSTIAINLALALAQEGAQTGLLDADIYGPSQPAMLGTQGGKPEFKEKLLSPIERHGVRSMSIGYLVDQKAPMVWRGPMIGKAMQQMIHDTNWGALDYLVVDLPPGTGDIQLSLCQKIPVSGAVMVTTPQELALLDVRRACEMFNKMNVPLLGVVENMSLYQCSHCGHEEQIFGVGGGSKLAQEYGITLLGQVPLDVRIGEMTDSGDPPVVADAKSPYAKIFYEIARKVAAYLSLQAKDYSTRFPKIVVKHDTHREKDA